MKFSIKQIYKFLFRINIYIEHYYTITILRTSELNNKKQFSLLKLKKKLHHCPEFPKLHHFSKN